MTTCGLLLAAGAGRRMGLPKSQLRDPHGVPYLDRAVGALLDGGCATVTVVLGAGAEVAVGLLEEVGWTQDDAVEVVVATDWDEGMGASLREGLIALQDSAGPTGDTALVTLVDLLDVDARVVARLLEGSPGASTLARATYDGVGGHPVLIGRTHWDGVVQTVRGDRGARDYLAGRDVHLVECGDLATGRDLDVPGDLPGRG